MTSIGTKTANSIHEAICRFFLTFIEVQSYNFSLILLVTEPYI